ncbi:MAG: ArsR family transcriptional regulator [Anaerolineae bacterium]|nr:MAG: ArsR family transcriptional regulator [Anaerolineae bacterium]
MSSRKSPSSLADLASILKVLADSQRLQILNLIIEGTHTSRALSAATGLSKNLLSHHLKTLKDAGLVKVDRDPLDQRWQYHTPDSHRLTEVQFLLSHFLHPARIQPRSGIYGPHGQPAPYQPPRHIQFDKEFGMTSTKIKMIFLCSGNSARSQMAEAFLRHHAGDDFEVYSAGTEPKGMNPYTVRAMDELGIDMSGHHSKSVREFLGHMNFGYVITVCDDAEENCPAVFLSQGQHLHWSFEDPAKAAGSDEEVLAKFRGVRDQINNRIQAWLTELETIASLN